MIDYVVGVCVRCAESHMFTSPAARDRWLASHVAPEPVNRWVQDVEAGAIG